MPFDPFDIPISSHLSAGDKRTLLRKNDEAGISPREIIGEAAGDIYQYNQEQEDKKNKPTES